jgi:hypothetical protein
VFQREKQKGKKKKKGKEKEGRARKDDTGVIVKRFEKL